MDAKIIHLSIFSTDVSWGITYALSSTTTALSVDAPIGFCGYERENGVLNAVSTSNNPDSTLVSDEISASGWSCTEKNSKFTLSLCLKCRPIQKTNLTSAVFKYMMASLWAKK